MPWNNRISYPLNQTSVVANAPERSGVYVLSSKTTWVYIGEAESIRAQLVRWIFSAGSAPTVIGAMFLAINASQTAVNWAQVVGTCKLF